jgi:phosphoglycolate phosphatase-like HAD superfamily hydrolase
VESPSYLRLDTAIPGARTALAALRARYDLVLVTMRHDRPALLEQLDRLALSGLFSAVHCRDGDRDGLAKAELLGRGADIAPGSAVVGDSEADVEVARALGALAVCVTTGVRSRRYLRALGPDRLIASVALLPQALAAPQPANA